LARIAATAPLLILLILVTFIAPPTHAEKSDYSELVKLLERLRSLNPFAPNPQLVHAAQVFKGLAECSTGLVSESAVELSKLAMEAAKGGLAVEWWRASQDLFRAVASMPWELNNCPSSLIYEALYYAFGSVGSYTFTPPHGPSFASDVGQLVWWVISSLGGNGFASTASSIAIVDPNSGLALTALLGRADKYFWTHVLSDVSTRRGLCLIFALAKPDTIPGSVAEAALSILAGRWAQDPSDALVYAAKLWSGGDRLCALAVTNLMDALMWSKGYLKLVVSIQPYKVYRAPSGFRNAAAIGSINTPRLLALSSKHPTVETAAATMLAGETIVSPSTLSAILISTVGPALLPRYNTIPCKLYLQAASDFSRVKLMEPVGIHAWNRLATLALLCYASTGDEATVARLLMLQPYLPIHPGLAKIVSKLNLKGNITKLTAGYPILASMGLVKVEPFSPSITLPTNASFPAGKPLDELALEAVLAASGLMKLNRTTLYKLYRTLGDYALELAASYAAALPEYGKAGRKGYMLVDSDAKLVIEELLKASIKGGADVNSLYRAVFSQAVREEHVNLKGMIPVPVDAFRVEVRALRDGLARLSNVSGEGGEYVYGLERLVGRLDSLVSSGRYHEAVNVSYTLRDTLLSNPRGFALLLIRANYTVGDAGITLLLARASSIVAENNGRFLLSPETIDDVMARIEDAITRLYLHPRHVTTAGEKGAAVEEGAGGAGASKLLEELRKALQEGDIVKAAKLIAEIYATGNPSLVGYRLIRLVKIRTNLNSSEDLNKLRRQSQQIKKAGIPLKNAQK
jgi:hypothetical protein